MQSSSECHGFLYSDVFKRVMEVVNNVDVGELGAGSLPGVQLTLKRQNREE